MTRPPASLASIAALAPRARSIARVIALCLPLAAGPAIAVDYSISGFGTLGYARSNESYTYQRFIDDSGTLKRDSVAGLQLDAKWNNEWASTVQVKAAADTNSDSRFKASVAWAFVSYRPSNDWLFRFGKQRIPLYLFSESYDVGTTYDFARLPTEMYSLVPSNDAISLSFDRTFRVRDGELVIEGYAAKAPNNFRYWVRDDVPGVQSTAAAFLPLEYKGGGVLATYKVDDDTFRIGLLRAAVRSPGGVELNNRFPFVAIAPGGIGYYQVSPTQPGPGVGTISSVINTTFAAGADVALPGEFRVIAEFARSTVPHSDIAPKANRGYASLLKRLGRWTPYVTYAFLHSPRDQIERFTEINDNTVPGFIPGAALINASQRAGADAINVYDQSSWAFGSSYSFSATSKLKAEFQRVHVGAVSKLVDSPPGETIRDHAINVLSLSYSFVY